MDQPQSSSASKPSPRESELPTGKVVEDLPEDSVSATSPPSVKPSVAGDGNAGGGGGGGGHGLISGDVKQYVLEGISPKAFLALFTLLNMFIYGDRGLFGSAIETIHRSQGFSDTLIGLLGSLFTIGYTASSPVFANAVTKHPPIKITALGIAIWCVAVVLTGLGPNYGTIAFGRVLSGVGEASFLCSSPTLINSTAPPEKRSVWLAIFFSSITVGYAFGLLIGGQLIGSAVFGDNTWRYLFVGEAIFVIPIVVYLLFLKGPSSIAGLGGEVVDTSKKTSAKDIMNDLRTLATNWRYMLVVAGLTTQSFVVGGFSLYGVSYTMNVVGLSEAGASIGFGGVALFAGFFGTAFGGLVLDSYRKKTNSLHNVKKSLNLAVRVMLFCGGIAVPLGYLTFNISGVATFFIFIALAEFFLFGCISPSNAAILWSVPLKLQPFAMAMSMVITHALGDAISSLIIGSLLDKTNRNYRLVMSCVMTVLLVGLIAWLVCILKGNKELAREETEEDAAETHGVKQSRELALIQNQYETSKPEENKKRVSIMKTEVMDEATVDAEVTMRVTQERLSLMGHL